MTAAIAESSCGATASIEDAARYDDVDLIIPVRNQRFIVPASDRSVVPHLLTYRCWEPHLTRYFSRVLQPSHTFMDVGANFGYFTVLCAPLVERVIAFEPAARTRRYCASNIAVNGLTNVELFSCGLWNETAALQLLSDASGVNAVISSSNDPALEPIEVVSLDGWRAEGRLQLSRLDMIKMDVEGAELAALAGMKDTIAQFRPAIVMEANRPMLATFGITIDDVWAFFTALGYELRVFEHWQERDPIAASTLDELRDRCPSGGLTDIVATPSERPHTLP